MHTHPCTKPIIENAVRFLKKKSLFRNTAHREGSLVTFAVVAIKENCGCTWANSSAQWAVVWPVN